MITGGIDSVSVPEVEAGQTLKSTVVYSASNPGAYYWKTWLIAVSSQIPGMESGKMLSETRELGSEGGRTKNSNLGTMPNKSVAITFQLFASDQASDSFDWDAWATWMAYGYGLPEGTVYLGSEYAFVDPVAETPTYETLEVDITPTEGGYVTTDPISEEGKSVWYDDDTGTFPYGTNVEVTAIPSPGYEFDHWSDEIVGGVSYSNPAYAQTMTEKRAVKAHFREVETVTERLEIDITPTEGGYVTTDPASEEGKSVWYHNDTGYYPYGTEVEVTAVPNPGYAFDHWSDEIAGGVSYSNPEYAKSMTETRSVKAHFREIEETTERLEVDITPTEGGYVTTDPISEEGKSVWYDDDTGTFPYGTNVEVTAIPSPGYEFDHWSDEIVGGVSYSNPSYAKTMTESRSVKAHFRETSEPSEEGIRGSVTKVEPSYFQPGENIDLKVSYTVYADDIVTQAGWQTRVVVEVNGYQGEEIQDHTGAEAVVDGLVVSLGTMPSTGLSGTLKLEGRPLDGDWETLDSGKLSIGAGSEPSEEGWGTLKWVALGAAALLALSSGSDKKAKTSPKRKK